MREQLLILDAGTPGLKATIESIDNRSDFKTYMQNYAYTRGSVISRGPRREGPADEGFVSCGPISICCALIVSQLPPIPSHQNALRINPQSNPSVSNSLNSQTSDRPRPTFGIDLAEQMTRDNAELPPIIEKCCQAIEKHGIRSQGIYRVNGTTRKVIQLKEKLDRGVIVCRLGFTSLF